MIVDSGLPIAESARLVPLSTPKGEVVIHPNRTAGTFSGLKLDNGLGHFSHYSSIIQKLEVFEKVATSKDGRVALAVLEEETIVGYVVCHYPEPGERWRKLDDLMYELAAIEVSRNFRGMRLSSTMVRSLINDYFFEEKIAYMQGYSWHWDLDGNRLTMAQYRKLMMTLLRGAGFQEYYTNEPNIALREENLFMARIGPRVSEQDQQRFRNLRFGIVNR